MNITDWIGFIGVAILLAAFFLNLFNRLNKDSIAYLSIEYTWCRISLLCVR